MEELIKYFNGNSLPAEVYKQKYAKIGEELPNKMLRRISDEFAEYEFNRITKVILQDKFDVNKLSSKGKDYIEYIKTTINKETFKDFIFEFFKDFKYVVPGGSVLENLGSDEASSLSNCFVIDSPQDSYSSIMQSREYLTQLMKRRGGVGKDLSQLRPRGTIVKNAAKTSTGAASFMDVESALTNEIAQGGRRGALMLTLSIVHPDAEEFITKKQDLTKVTGANISIKITDEFMHCVLENKDFIQKFPINLDIEELDLSNISYNELIKIDKGYIKKIKALDLWNKIIHCAWNTAEPGIIFEDAHFKYSPDGVYPEFKMVSTNPCGEIGMQGFDSCRLMHHNLTSYIVNPFTKEAFFDYKTFEKNCYYTMILGDVLVDLEIKAIEKILMKIQSDSNSINNTEYDLWNKIRKTAKQSRRVGIGFTGLADVFAMLSIKYGSEESIELTKEIFYTKHLNELQSSIDMAILYNPFEGYNLDKEYLNNDPQNPFYFNLLWMFPEEVHRMKLNNGRRNLSWSTAAPTGSVSILTQTTSGIEPLFLPYYERKKKINNTEEKVTFIDKMGEKFTSFNVIHQPFKQWLLLSGFTENEVNDFSLEELDNLFKKSPWYGSTANELNYKERILMQSVIQKYTTHSISSTINLPKETKDSVIDNIYREGYKADLKGLTVYRDGCRDGILTSVNSNASVQSLKETTAPKRPKELPAHLHIVSIKGIKFAIIVGLYENKPYEVFAFELVDPKTTACDGKIVKISKRVYNFVSDKYTISNLELSHNNNVEKKAFTLYTSMSLRHGVPIKYIVKILSKVDENITSFAKALTRVLNQYVPKEILANSCPECNNFLIRENGCVHCSQCSYSEC